MVRPVKAHQFRPSDDNYNEAVREVKRNGFTDGAKGSKRNIEFQTEVKSILRKWRDGHYDESRGLKRRLDDGDGAPGAKRSRTNLYDGTATNGYINTSTDHETLPSVDVCMTVHKPPD